MTEDNQKLLEFAKTLANQAGHIMRDYFLRDDKNSELKSDKSVVTAADKKINQLVIDAVAKAYPTHGVLAEEGSDNQHRNELWVCDPIDGTQAFVLGIPTAMFSLAFVVAGEPIVAVTYDPFQDKLFAALKGGGATCNDKPIKVTSRETLQDAHIATVSGYGQLMERRTLFDGIESKGAYMVITHGNVFKGCLVADGHIDGYLFPGLSAHDIAAEQLIVEEAGGKVTDVYGHKQRYDGAIKGAIISNGVLHDELVAAVNDFGTEKYLGN
jgi:fructose-1,6-bisphosphatase/inositol monophosphatase family enzyme